MFSISPATSAPHDLQVSPFNLDEESPYFWGNEPSKTSKNVSQLVRARTSGYEEARSLIGNATMQTLDDLVASALTALQAVFEGDTGSSAGQCQLVDVRLSDDLVRWRKDQHKAGHILPSKGKGLKEAPLEVLQILGIEAWPKSLVTSNALFGCGWANFLIGAYDARVLFSNYCTDMAFYYEHGYHNLFPEFEPLIKEASIDPHALRTPGGTERRQAVTIGIRYIRGKIDLEVQHKARLGYKTAKLDRRRAQTASLSESSLVGMIPEAILRGFDPAAVMNDLIWGSPGTDVLDVGSDLHNSEVMNSFLGTADMTSTGIVTEEALRRVYDAYAHAGARMLVERWSEPIARMNACLLVWHMVNDRHMFLRRAVLGYSMVRKSPVNQREGDFDEVFDDDYHTTGFSRPLRSPCDGGKTCDQVSQLIDDPRSPRVLADVWNSVVINPLKYVSGGVVDEEHENKLIMRMQVVLAQAYSSGMILEMTWLLAHASQHAWQVNFMMEAAMFGSLLDDGALKGKLDR